MHGHRGPDMTPQTKGCGWCGADLAGRSHRQFCSSACRVRAHRANRHAEGLWGESVSGVGHSPAGSQRLPPQPQPPRQTVPLFPLPAGLDPESRRVVGYVNGEVERWNAWLRSEPVDLILQAAQERLRRLAR